MEEEISLCNCGAEPDMDSSETDHDEYGYIDVCYAWICESCGASSGYYEFPQEADDAWNEKMEKGHVSAGDL